jgi:hypothetical protein
MIQLAGRVVFAALAVAVLVAFIWTAGHAGLHP